MVAFGEALSEEVPSTGRERELHTFPITKISSQYFSKYIVAFEPWP